jgi:hypothetical protein
MTRETAMVENGFQPVWWDIYVRLQPGQRVRTRNLGDGIPAASFTVVRVEVDRVVVEAGQGERCILREEFEQGFLVWPKYCTNAIAPGVLQHCAVTLSYVFGIFRWCSLDAQKSVDERQFLVCHGEGRPS